ncbi:MAG: hypothetical protein Q8T11_18265 [Elusimicrobiota bacterium]|nr:hypothetical protein [Elusimicrobiota bacterium]
MPIIAWLLGAALSASAHEFYPIHPVRATLRVEPDRIVADLRADSIFWIEEVTGLHPMPARDWPAQALSRTEAYANAHFRLASDGRPLMGKLVAARYRQFPWEVNAEGVFFLRLVYPPAEGSALSGTANFYEEYRREIAGEVAEGPPPDAESYRTLLEIPGRRRAAFTLTHEAPSFSVSTADARRPPLAMALEGLRRGAEGALGMASGFPALLAIALCLGARPPGRAALAALLASALSGFAAGGFLDAPSWLIWSATLGAALAAGRGQPAAVLSAAAMAAAATALAWRSAAAPLLPHGALAAAFACAGALGAGAALLVAARLGIRAEHRRLADVSESRVEELFARRVRLTATALAMIGAYGIWQSLQR